MPSCRILVSILTLHLLVLAVMPALDQPLPPPWQVDGLTLVCDEFSGSGNLIPGALAEDIDGSGWATTNATLRPRRDAGRLVSGGTDSLAAIKLPPLSPLGEVTVYATVDLRGTNRNLMLGFTDGVHHPRTGGSGPLVWVSGDRRLAVRQDAATSLKDVVIPQTAVAPDGTVTLVILHRIWEKTVIVSANGQELARATMAVAPSTPRNYFTIAYDDANPLNVPALDALRIEYVPLARPMPMVPHRTVTVTDTSLTGITNAIHAANAQSGPNNIIAVSIPRGNYTFRTPAGFTDGQLFHVLGLKYLIIDWNGSNITIDDPIRGLFSLSSGNHVIVRNIASIDYPTANLPFTQGTVRAINTGARTFDLEIDAGFPLPNSSFFVNATRIPSMNWGQVIDPARPGHQKAGTGLHYNILGPQYINGRTFRYTLNAGLGSTVFGSGFTVGSRFVHCPRQGNSIFRIFDANDIRLENITGHACGDFWSMTSVGANFSYHNVRILVKPGRLMSSNGDGVTGNRHPSVPRGNRGWIEHCIFEGLGDDACNQMQADGLFISNTVFRNTRRFGVWINGTPNAIIKDCLFDHVGRRPIQASRDPHLYVQFPYTFASRNVLIVRNDIRSAWDDGIHVHEMFRDNFNEGTDMSPNWNTYWRIIRNASNTPIRIRNATNVRCVGNTNGAGGAAAITFDTRNCRDASIVSRTYHPPSIAAITPNAGPVVGGNTATITGSSLCDTVVTVDGLRVYPDKTRPRTDMRMSLTMPAHAAGRVDVAANAFLSGSATVPGGYTYGSAPAIAALSPTVGTTAGGTMVTITGTNLTGTSSVTFGGTAATTVTVASPTSVTCVTPAKPAGAVTVVLTTASGTATMPNAYTYVTNATAPIITSQPASVTVNPNQTATFTVVATGTPAPTYQWQRNGTNISGATATSYTTPVLTAADHGTTFRCQVTNIAGSVTSAEAILAVNAAPAITSQPSSQTRAVGQTATFTVTASGRPSPTYQWQKNGTDISGATAANYTTPVLTAADHGAQYRCVATNSLGSATSNAATITMSGIGWQASYYDNGDFTGTKLERTDVAINFDWGTNAPMAGMGADTFSVRWRGMVTPAHSQTYTFTATTDDGVRVWVDGRLIIDRWVDRGATADSGTADLRAGTPVLVVMEYYERSGTASARLAWSSASQPSQPIPYTAVVPAPEPGQPGGGTAGSQASADSGGGSRCGLGGGLAAMLSLVTVCMALKPQRTRVGR